MSATAPRPQPEDSLSYELLLRKSCDTCASADGGDSADDGASTAEPVSSAASSSADSAPATAPSRGSVRLLRSVNVHDARVDERLAQLVQQTRELSEVVFEEDCLQEVTKKSGWKLSLLVSDDLAVLCGFIVAKVANGSLSIAKLAVPAEFRGSGFGKLIMEELMKSAKKQGDVYEVCLSSLPNVVTFYQRLGFKAFKGLKLQSDEDLVEGQVYMEKKLRPRPRRK